MRHRNMWIAIVCIYTGCHLNVFGQGMDSIVIKPDMRQMEELSKAINREAGEKAIKIKTDYETLFRRIREQDDAVMDWLRTADQKAWEALTEQKERGLSLLKERWEKVGQGGRYLSRFDTLQTLFSFAGMESPELMRKATDAVTLMKDKLGATEVTDQWIRERQQMLYDALSRHSSLPSGIKKAFDQWKGEAWVWKARAEAWRETLNNPQQIEKEALRILHRQPFFQKFMAENGELARLFGPPSGASDLPAGTPIPGLQTRASVAEALQARFGVDALQSGGALQQQIQNGMDQLSNQQNNPIAQAVSEVTQAVEQVKATLSPAQQEKADLKAQPLKKRFEFGANLQSATRMQNFPAVRDIGLSAGYKLNPRSVVGIGIAYKFALGESWKDIEWTHEGVGFRSFFDWRLASAGSKLLKGIWLTGGFEMNYWARIARDAQWEDLAWEKSGLVGVTKTIAAKRKEGKVQVLYNLIGSNGTAGGNLIFRYSKNF